MVPEQYLTMCSFSYHSCAVLAASGQLKCWGYGRHGQLGYGSKADIGDAPGQMGADLPLVKLEPNARVTQISCGYYYTCALLHTGTLQCFGSNSHGQLGLGHNSNVGDEPHEMGTNLLLTDLGSGQEVIQVACGDFHTCVVLMGGTTKCFGWGPVLGLGDGPGPQSLWK